MSKRKISIYWVIAGAFLLLLLMALSLVLLYSASETSQFESRVRQGTLGNLTVISQMISNRVLTGKIDSIRADLLELSAAQPGADFWLTAPDGTLLIDSLDPAPSGKLNLSLLQTALAQTTPVMDTSNPVEPLVAVAFRQADGAPVGVLIHRMSWRRQYDQMRSNITSFAYNTGSLVLAAAILMAILAWAGLVRPLRKFRRLVESIQGDDPKRLPEIALAELGSATHAFNQMLDRLSQQRSQLDQANRTLEAAVETRTSQLEQRSRQFLALSQISQQILSADTLQEAFQQAAREISQATGLPIVLIEAYDHAADCLTLQASIGIPQPAADSLCLPLEQALSGAAVRAGQPISLEENLASLPPDPRLNGSQILSGYVVPMKIDAWVIGALTLADTRPGPLAPEIRQMASSLAVQVSTLSVRFESQAVLQQSEERLSLGMESAGLGLWDWNVTTGELLYDHRFAELMSLPNRGGRMDISEWEKAVHPADFPAVQEQLNHHLAGRIPSFEAEYRLKARHPYSAIGSGHPADGSGHPADGDGWRWVLDRGAVMERTPAGQPRRMLGVLRDISAQRDLQERLTENETRLQSILSSVRDVIWSMQPDLSAFIYINPAAEAIYGHSLADFERNPRLWYDLMEPDDQAGFDRIFATFEQSGHADYTHRIRHPDGSTRILYSHAQLVRTPQGDPLRIDGITVDITRQRQAEEDLRKRDQVLQAMTQAAEIFLSTENWGANAPQVLEQLGQALQAGRVHLFDVETLPGGGMRARQRFEWCAPAVPSITPSATRRMSMTPDGLERWEKALRSGQVMQGNICDLPAAERGYFDAMGVVSMLTVPIFVSGRWWGYLTFDECAHCRIWSEVEVETLRLAAGVLGAAIQRQQTADVMNQLYSSERVQRELAQVLREVGVSLNTTLRYDAVLDRCLEQAFRVVPYDTAMIMLVVDDRAYTARQRNFEVLGEQAYLNALRINLPIETTPSLKWMKDHRLPLIVSDVERYSGWVKSNNVETNTRSWAGAPITIQGQLVAFLSLHKWQPNYFTPEHAERLSIFADQVGLALQNATLLAETMDLAEREHHLNEVTRAVSSTLKLDEIIRVVVRLAAELVQADAGAMAMLTPDQTHMTYPYLYNLGMDEKELAVPPDGLAWQVVNSGKALIINNYAQIPQARQPWVETGISACLAVPVAAGEEKIGALGLFSLNPDKTFSNRELALVESVGRQMGIAIQNARLILSAEQRARESDTLREAVLSVTSALDLNEVANKILEQMAKVLPYDSSAIFLLENGGAHMVAGRGFPSHMHVIGQTFPADSELFTEIVQSGHPIVLEDAHNDVRFKRWGGAEYIHGWIGLPLLAHGEPLGFLTMDSYQVGAYSPADAALGMVFANEVAIAIENARLFKQVQELAITDPLTGLYNRRYFAEAATRELERSRRYQRPLALIMMDIDLFKLVNDQYGHLAGDRALVMVARRCRETLREMDITARYGGEEFIMLLPETDLERGQLAAERVRLAIMSQPVDGGAQAIKISVSLGVAELDATCLDLQTLINRADVALYQAKQTGRGKVSVWLGQPARGHIHG